MRATSPAWLKVAASAIPVVGLMAALDSLADPGRVAWIDLFAVDVLVAVPLVLLEWLLLAAAPNWLTLSWLGRSLSTVRASTMYAGATCLTALFLATRGVASWFLVSFRHQGLIAASLVASFGLMLGLCAVLFVPLVRFWTWALDMAGAPSRLVSIFVLATFGGVATAWAIEGGVLGARWNLLPPSILLAGLAGQVVAAGLLSRGNRRLSWLILSLGLVFSALAVHGGGLPRGIPAGVDESRGLAGQVVRLVRRVTDHDHDGFSPWLGGGDCDDQDPDVHPGAMDFSGNGRDEDCDGQDSVGPHPIGSPDDGSTARRDAGATSLPSAP